MRNPDQQENNNKHGYGIELINEYKNKRLTRTNKQKTNSMDKAKSIK